LLQSALELLRDRLDAALQMPNPQSEPWVTLANPVDLNGGTSESVRNKIIMTLVGLHTDPTIRTDPRPRPGQPPVPPLLTLTALVLFIANFSEGDYPTGLSMLSRAIAFFQQNPIVTPQRVPGADQGKIMIEFVNFDLAQTNDLMAALGMKYRPCALYRVGPLPFNSTP
jgi:hypothetical protein